MRSLFVNLRQPGVNQSRQPRFNEYKIPFNEWDFMAEEGRFEECIERASLREILAGLSEH